MQAKRIIRWALDIAAGLNYLNSNLKMSHQDVKPHNVLLDRHYTIKICDLGFKQLKRMDDDEEKRNSNHNGDFDIVEDGLLVDEAIVVVVVK